MHDRGPIARLFQLLCTIILYELSKQLILVSALLLGLSCASATEHDSAESALVATKTRPESDMDFVTITFI